MLRRLVLLVAALGVWWYLRAPAGRLEARPMELERVVAFSGEPLEDAMAAGRCGEMTDELIQHPNWTLGVTIAGSSCFGWTFVSTYEIHADGTMRYRTDGPTRTIELDPMEMAFVRGLGRLDCNERVMSVGHAMWIVPGTPSLGAGARIVSTSLFGEALERMLDDAVDREFRGQLRELSPSLTLRAGEYRVALHGDTLEVRRGHRLVAEHELTAEQVVELVEAIIAKASPDPYPGHTRGRGTLTVDGVSYPIRVGLGTQGWALLLLDALDHAAYDDAQRR